MPVEFNITQTDHSFSYKLMTNLIVPRPIAWITSVNAAGVINAAPFSFFNMLGAEPPILAVGIGRRPGTDTPKDSALNIRSSGEFVVNLVTEEMVELMNASSVDFPNGRSEVELLALDCTPGRQVKVPHLAACPASFECRLVQYSQIGENLVFIGQIVHLRVADEIYDADKKHIRSDAFHPVGRMGAPATYVRARDRFNMPRLNYQQWLERD